MATVISPAHGKVRLPAWVTDLAAFRRWVQSGEPPEGLRAHFINGEVWMDFIMEEAQTHNFVKNALYAALEPLTENLGLFFSEGMLFTNEDAGLGTVPDAMFVSFATLDSDRAELVSGAHPEATATELTGSPDVVIEVVSRGSVEKDLELLVPKYHDAGVREYWVIDARDEDAIRFEILKRGRKGFAPVRATDGWLKSPVFGKSFRLVRREVRGFPRYRLEVR